MAQNGFELHFTPSKPAWPVKLQTGKMATAKGEITWN
jgi:hypothetical protein